jgi:hypothetical protein
METWRKIEEYDNYSVSDFGNVRNDKTGRILKPTMNKCGYYLLNLYDKGKIKYFRVHRLVATAFIENPTNKEYVDHIDGNKLNNNRHNLRWATNSENQRNTGLTSKNTSGVKGIYFQKITNKWYAQITVDRITVSLGYFNTMEEAKEARQIRANQAFGVFVNACEKL